MREPKFWVFGVLQRFPAELKGLESLRSVEERIAHAKLPEGSKNFEHEDLIETMCPFPPAARRLARSGGVFFALVSALGRGVGMPLAKD